MSSPKPVNATRLFPLERFTLEQAKALARSTAGRVHDDLLHRDSFLNFNEDDLTYVFTTWCPKWL